MRNRSPRGATRYRVLAPVAFLYLATCTLLRAVLVVYEGDAALFGPAALSRVFGIGALYDLAALAWILSIFVVNAWLWPDGHRGRRGHALSTAVLGVLGVCALGFGLVGEMLFWNEFSARFNFIAVDYLVYTREVVGNIEQSYPVAWIVVGLTLFLVPAAAILGFRLWRAGQFPAPRPAARTVITVGYGLLLGTLFGLLGEGPHAGLASPAEKELASNGHYSLLRAFRRNELDYDRFYATLPDSQAAAVLREELEESGIRQADEDADRAQGHLVRPDGPPIRKNVVLVSIESLGADYVEAFGGRKGLTPNLGALAADSLIFRDLYATGLRTVRGLEALALSLPPTPGRAVPAREHNRGLMSLGSVLRENGYDSLYIYGGYAYFDNMRDFFANAGYEVRDRTDIDGGKVHHETIWGVADEDLFTFTVEELDRRAATGRPFFAHVMTTSNHRPYTYPEGRIDIPSHSGRDGAVKYTDWAIGAFLAEARRRPWFTDTVFVLVADHTSHGRGRIDLPPENYRIPLLIHAPGFVEPGTVDWTASQIDVAPTLLGLLRIPYDSHFFGQDILANGMHHQRAFMANYLTVGYMENGLVVELAPQGRVRVVRAADGRPVPADDPTARELIDETVSYYQTAARQIAAATAR